MSVSTESTFFTRPVKWKDGVRRGFVVTPNDRNGTTWGEPYEDEKGNLIVPGTPDGPFDRAFLGAKSGEWKTIRKRKFQSAGNIDWKGPWSSAAATKRAVVTVNGPSQRYWNNGTFLYGTEQKHQYIYSNGRVAGIAPWPVLGACTRLHEGDLWIIAMAKKGALDVCIARRGVLSLQESLVEEEEFSLYKRLHADIDRSLEPLAEGWHVLGEWIGYDDGIPSVDPEAPWFFNENGTQCRTMRRCVWTHFDQNDDAFDDTMYREMHCTVDLDTLGASFSNADPYESIAGAFSFGFSNYAKWNTEYTVEKVRSTYIQPAEESGDGYAHEFQEDYIKNYIQMNGRSKIAVDFNPDTNRWVYGWVAGTIGRTFNQYWTLGVDEPNTPEQDDGGRVANTGSEDGPQPKPEDLVPSENNHYESIWIGFQEDVVLSINNSPTSPIPVHAEVSLLWGRQGSATVAAGGDPTESDPTLKFIDAYDTWIQYLDLRHNLLVGNVYYGNLTIEDESFFGYYITEEELQWALVAQDAPTYEEEFYTADDTPLAEDGQSRTFMRHMALGPLRPGGAAFGFTRLQMEEWPENYEDSLTAFNYSATMTNKNEDESYWEPHWKGGYHGFWLEVTRPYWDRISIDAMLRDPVKTSIKGVFGTTEKDEHLVAIEYFDKTEKANVSKSWSYGVEGEPLGQGGGDSIHPGGLL